MKQEFIEIAKKIEKAGGRLFLVGGAVRDRFRGVPPKDMDFMIQGVSVARGVEILASFGDVQQVIGNAPVFLVNESEFAFARKEVSIAPGKDGFEFFSTADVTVAEDMIRRDFTIGAICQDVLTGEIIDLHNGVDDIRARVIRHVDATTFVQSPERGLRAFSQSARFDFDIDSETVELISQMSDDFVTIPREQIWRHFEKFLSNGKPGRFIDGLVATGWIDFFPEIHVHEALNSDCSDNLAVFLTGMSFLEEESFRERICAPKRRFGRAVEVKHFGQGGKPPRWVEGRDIAHVVDAGPEMGVWVRWCFVGQINGLFSSKEEAVGFVEANV